jgi:hypothetical protein
MIFQHKDGALRLYDGTANTPYYYEILFTNANLSGPIARAKTTERLILNKGKIDDGAYYVESDDAPIAAPLKITFSCLMEDGGHYATLDALLRGNATIDGVAITSTQGSTKNNEVNDNPIFADSSKRTLNVEVLYEGAINEGIKWAEVYFPPEQQDIKETFDSIILNITGYSYGTIARITNFTTGTPIG